MRILTHFLIQTLSKNSGYSGRLRLMALKGDGSERRVYRLFTGKRTHILVFHPEGRKGIPSENDSFFYIAGHLKSKGLPTPDIRGFDRLGGRFLLEDFGDLSLEERIKGIGDPEKIKEIYKQILHLLLRIQIEGSREFDTRRCYDTALYDGLFSWRRESQYFIKAFLKGYLGWEKVSSLVEQELKDLALQVERERTHLFLYRDFQSRNIMIYGGEFGLIDFQAARLGPPQYDLASLLIDPYVGLPGEIQEELLDYYIREFSSLMPVNQKAFRANYEVIAFQRNLQILGAFGFLSRVKGKTYFEDYIPAALSSLKKRVSDKGFQPYKRVRELIGDL